MSFNDHFSRQSDTYLKARPTYPDELFTYLASIAPSKKLCWDCATGNGQAAISLATHFEQVIATDGSEKQIQNAMLRSNIEYRVAVAEDSGLQANSVDLITVATGAHWFDLPRFYTEAERVAKPNGILALWTYSSASITPAINELMEWFAYDYLYKYWPDGRWYVRNKYETLPFPFTAMDTPVFKCRMQWNREQWLNYVKSWSSYTNYVTQHNADPLTELLPKLEPFWQAEDIKQVTWPLHLKCTRL